MSDARIEQVKESMEAAVSFYVDEVKRKGPFVKLHPVLLVTLPTGATVMLPLTFSADVTAMTALICRRVLLDLRATCYAFICDTRTDDKNPLYGFHYCGGFPGWDIAGGTLYKVRNRKMKDIVTIPTLPSTVPRVYAYTIIPNLMDEYDWQSVQPEDFAAVSKVAAILVGEIKHCTPAEFKEH